MATGLRGVCQGTDWRSKADGNLRLMLLLLWWQRLMWPEWCAVWHHSRVFSAGLARDADSVFEPEDLRSWTIVLIKNRTRSYPSQMIAFKIWFVLELNGAFFSACSPRTTEPKQNVRLEERKPSNSQIVRSPHGVGPLSSSSAIEVVLFLTAFSRHVTVNLLSNSRKGLASQPYISKREKNTSVSASVPPDGRCQNTSDITSHTVRPVNEHEEIKNDVKYGREIWMMPERWGHMMLQRRVSLASVL